MKVLREVDVLFRNRWGEMFRGEQIMTKREFWGFTVPIAMAISTLIQMLYQAWVGQALVGLIIGLIFIILIVLWVVFITRRMTNEQ